MTQFFTKKRIIAGAIVLVVILLGSGVVYAAKTWDQITNNQMDLFNQTVAPIPEETPTPAVIPSDTTAPSATPGDTGEPTPTPLPTIDPYEDIKNQADQSLMKDTLHVLLIGVDYATERQGWQKNFNSDVMLLLAINFKLGKVDMISFPRDSYAKIANIDGFYKLNFSLTAGGGINDKGFMNVCKSIQGLLDPKLPPVNYYIAVTMPVVKELTDAIGGVDYNLDLDFAIQGRSYKKGQQHMNGQAVLDYCRIRKGHIESSQAGDLNRVNRQKKMLVAVFKKLQSSATIFNVPSILTSMQGKVFTNMNYKQLAALALFGKDLPDNKISMRTLPGREVGSIFNYKFVLLNQSKRVQMLKEVYGISVAPQYKFAEEYARVQWAYMLGEGYLKEIDRLRKIDDALLDKKKIIIPEDIVKLDAAVKTTQEVMTKFRTRLFKDSKPVMTRAECTDIETKVRALMSTANTVLVKAGYKPNWKVSANKPGSMKMLE